VKTLRVNGYDMAYLDAGEGRRWSTCTARSAISALQP